TTQHVLRPQRLAAVRERDDDTLTRAHELRELGLGFGEAARRDRRALRLEGERLPLRERVELGSAVERQRREVVLFPDAAHAVGLEDEVGRAPQRRHEIAGDGARLALLTVPLLDEVDATFDGGEDRGGGDRMERPLRERRERADRLDLVPEELDAQGLAAGRRKDVDQAAANRELAPVVDALDPFVACERERLR